jgi:MerR family redox-sensitive transcriptional activator SoxR
MKRERSLLPKILTVGELAERSGVSVSAVHFWERQGLIEGWRTGGNQRRFERSTLRRVAIIKIAQAVKLDGCIGCGCVSLKRCPLHNPGDRLSRLGPGPRRVLT